MSVVVLTYLFSFSLSLYQVSSVIYEIDIRALHSQVTIRKQFINP